MSKTTEKISEFPYSLYRVVEIRNVGASIRQSVVSFNTYKAAKKIWRDSYDYYKCAEDNFILEIHAYDHGQWILLEAYNKRSNKDREIFFMDATAL